MENTTHPVKTRHRRVQIRMSTWLNIADCVLWMARCRSFWGERDGFSPTQPGGKSPPGTSCCLAASSSALLSEG